MKEENQQDGKKTNNSNIDISNMIGVSSKFAIVNKLITRDINNNNTNVRALSLYNKDSIATYLSNPYSYEKQLREAVTYIYGASPHFRRLIQYFAGLTDLSYVVAPQKIDPRTANKNTVGKNYRKVCNTLTAMNIKTQIPKIITVCLREDVFYGTLWVSDNNIIIQQLPSDYCCITTIEGNVANVTFDFSYFDSNSTLLQYYPDEFSAKYQVYQRNRTNKWIELDSPTSFAIKCNNDILQYATPPFAGLLREIYDIEDYKQLKQTKTELENYAMVTMKLPLNDDGSWGIDLPKAKEFWQNLDSVLPEEVGSVLSPMEMDKISFENSNTGNVDTVAEAEQNLFTAAGVSSLLFNNEKASANALLLSIKADQAITFGIVKSVEDMINRFIQSENYGKNFKVTFLDCSPYNRKECGDAYLKACQYGIPMISYYAASQGLCQSELDNMSYLEGEVLGLQSMFKPLQNSAQMSPNGINGNDSTEKGGAPVKDDGELTDSGEQSREDGDDWG